MKNRKIVTIGIIAAFLMTVLGAELAFARGGGGKGGGFNTASGPSLRMSQTGNTHQYQYRKQNQYQYRQDNGTFTGQSRQQQMQGDQNQLRSRKQLRDPATHMLETSE